MTFAFAFLSVIPEGNPLSPMPSSGNLARKNSKEPASQIEKPARHFERP